MAIGQLDEYFSGERLQFDLPLSPEGTEFQQQVWDALLSIPYGQTTSYGELAKLIDRPKSQPSGRCSERRQSHTYCYTLPSCHWVNR